MGRDMNSYPEVEIYENPEYLAEAVAQLFVREAVKSVEHRGRFMVAISGGSTPRLAHRLLCMEPFGPQIPWQSVNIFWVDDRCVPHDDPASNFGAADDDFLSRVDLQPDQVYPMPVTTLPKTGAIEYEQTIRSVFAAPGDELPRFDCVFLGIGTDGHTASLFPGQEELWDKGKLILAVRGGNPNVDRLTMTLPLINRAKHIVIPVSGRAKAVTLEEIFSQPEKNYPIQNVKPEDGKLSWLVDRDAAGMLPIAASE